MTRIRNRDIRYTRQRSVTELRCQAEYHLSRSAQSISAYRKCIRLESWFTYFSLSCKNVFNFQIHLMNLVNCKWKDFKNDFFLNHSLTEIELRLSNEHHRNFLSIPVTNYKHNTLDQPFHLRYLEDKYTVQIRYELVQYYGRYRDAKIRFSV